MNFDFGTDLRRWAVFLVVLVLLMTVSGAFAQVVPTPVGGSVIRGYFAVSCRLYEVGEGLWRCGNGISDDTAAIEAALADGRTNASAEYNGVPKGLYFPPGTYLVRKTLSWNGCCVTLQGAGPHASVIRLAPSSEGYGSAASAKPVLLTPAGISSFRQNIWDLGFSIGAGNPGAVAIDYVSNNNGSIHDVSIVSEDGHGIAGISLTRHYPGPLMIKNVLIHGFQTGITTAAYEYGATIESLTLEDQTVAGINDLQQTITVRGLKSTNSVPAIINNYGFAIVLGAKLTGGSGATQAIQSNGNLYLREVSSAGYGATLHDTSGGATKNITGTISEYIVGSPGYPGDDGRTGKPQPAD